MNLYVYGTTCAFIFLSLYQENSCRPKLTEQKITVHIVPPPHTDWGWNKKSNVCYPKYFKLILPLIFYKSNLLENFATIYFAHYDAEVYPIISALVNLARKLDT